MKTKDKVESGGYDRFELFAGETLTLSMSEDLAATSKTRWGEGDTATLEFASKSLTSSIVSAKCHHEGEGQCGVRKIQPP